MKLLVEGAPLRGTVEIPGSKSHTIRAVAIASLAKGKSVIEAPLESSDGLAAFHAYRAFGVPIESVNGAWHVEGLGGHFEAPANIIDVGNSGTTMLIALGSAALLGSGLSVLTGDEQVRRRPVGPLVKALNDLGAKARCTRDNGCPPVVVEGRIKGGRCTIEAMTSQYITALLINGPLADGDIDLDVPLLHEKPYVGITLDWLKRHGVKVTYAEDYSSFHIPAGQAYQPVHQRIPGDFSSATFFLAAGALQDNEVFSHGLDMGDSQGDKAVVEYLGAMGAEVSVEAAGVRVRAKRLVGTEIDLNATPDALPMMAALACFAKGTTRLVNVPQARLKETDRIATMRMELCKMGAHIEELEDGLVIHESAMRPAEVDGHGDHRIVMSLAIAGSMLPGTTTINGYEAVNVTYPTFLDALHGLGGKGRVV
ncbi:MAG: 3-phosphoshikimate 1-carboxyvinyltransferase [Candidatus Hydrogenedentes bacterium]|nr:3-phosphoshikimate 1-carboxyvinyltransferase [Candidatus Hydrogenedentota bacterium]